MRILNNTEIEVIARRMIAGTLPYDQWTHQAHFAAAIWLLREEGDTAFITMPDYIRRYNNSVGTPNSDSEGYHETITQASLRGAWDCLRVSPDASLSDILREIMTGELGQSDWLLDYWSRELLFSVQARREWAEPDIKPIPYPAL